MVNLNLKQEGELEPQTGRPIEPTSGVGERLVPTQMETYMVGWEEGEMGIRMGVEKTEKCPLRVSR